MTLQAGEDGKEQIVVMKNILTNENEEDVSILKNAGHYSIYAQYIYFHVHMTLENILPIDATNFVRDINMMSPVDEYSLAMWDIPYAQIHYANFYNGIAATPYAIIVDDQEKSVVITIRGTNSLEDWVADLQYVPQPLDKVGELCGFDGKGRHCHKGVLTRCKWTYHDIKKNGVLKNLYSSESPYKETSSDIDTVPLSVTMGVGIVSSFIGYLYSKCMKNGFQLLWSTLPSKIFGCTSSFKLCKLLNQYPAAYIVLMMTLGGGLVATLSALYFPKLFSAHDFVHILSKEDGANMDEFPSARKHLLPVMLLSCLMSITGFSLGPEGKCVSEYSPRKEYQCRV